MVRHGTYVKNSLLEVCRTPGARRRNLVVVTSVGFLFVLLVALSAGGVFDRHQANGQGDPNNVGAGGDDISSSDGDVDPDAITISPTSSGLQTNPPAPSPGDVTEAKPKPKPSPPPPPPVTYRPGELVVRENGMIMSKGLKSRILARTGQKVEFHNGKKSDIPFHIRPDGAATFSVPDDYGKNKGGWVYVSNSEGKEEKSGGVGAVMFDKKGRVVGYKKLLKNTRMNCSGGKTPWNTWVSCEEWEFTGQVWQVDPFDRRPPEKTSIGRIEGGRYEAFAYDDRNKTAPVFFATEDQRNGPTRRFRPTPSAINWTDPWSMLHGKGKQDYLVLKPNATNDKKTGTYEWVDSVHEGRKNAFDTYPSAEGLDRHENFLYMACKREKMLYVIDLDTNKYVRYSLELALFDGEPDQVTRILNDTNEVMYFNEDLGNISGIHARNERGQIFTILEGPDWSNEVTGVSFSPSGHHMYFCFQEDGVLFEVTREDGYPFQAKTLNVRYHNKPVESLWSRRLRLGF